MVTGRQDERQPLHSAVTAASGRLAATIAVSLGVLLAVLGAVVLSLLWWRADANLCVCEYCPDGYCTYARTLRFVLTQWDAASLRQLMTFGHGHPQAHSPLTPALHALVSLLVPHEIASFVVLNTATTLVTWVTLCRVTRSGWSPPRWFMALLFSAFCTHVLVIRAIARPQNDAVGMACIIGALLALQRYLGWRGARAASVLLGMQLVGLFSRVSFIPMLGMPVLAEFAMPGPLVDRARRAVRSGLLFGWLPGALFLGINAVFGTLHVVDAFRFAHLEAFTHFYTLTNFLIGVALAGQGYALLVAGVSRATWTSLVFRLHVLWVALYLTFLGAGGGALWPRYFLPIVPSVFVLATPMLSDLAVRHPWNVRALLAVFTVGNVLYLTPVSRDLQPAARLLVGELRARFAGQPSPEGLTRLAPDVLTVTTNYEADRARLAADERMETGWIAARSQGPDVTVRVDLGSVHVVRGLALWSTLSEYPRAYRVETSIDGTAWTLAAEGRGARGFVGFLDEMPHLFVPLAGMSARYLRISPTRSDPAGWVIRELAVYGLPEPGRRPAG